MSTHSSTQALPGIGASSERTNLRAYLAGTSATTALIAGLVILFLAAGAFVAFSGNPFGGDDASESVTIGNQAPAGAPEAAALALAAGPDAVAATPTALVGGPGAAVDGGAAFAAAPPGAAPPGATSPGGGPGGGGGEPVPTPTGGGGALGNTVGAVDDAASNLGLDLGLGQTTDPITDGPDRTVTETLNNVGGGGGGGGRGLGDRVNDTVGGVRDGVNRGLGGLGLGN